VAAPRRFSAVTTEVAPRYPSNKPQLPL